jgi:ABC-type phosphate transport system substrate-binding protein
LGKANTFPDGSNVVPIDQSEGRDVRDEFYAKVVSKNASQLTAYWAKVIFTGGDSCPPKQMEGSVAVRRAVAINPKAIGYIDRSSLDSSVRVVLDP